MFSIGQEHPRATALMRTHSYGNLPYNLFHSFMEAHSDPVPFTSHSNLRNYAEPTPFSCILWIFFIQFYCAGSHTLLTYLQFSVIKWAKSAWAKNLDHFSICACHPCTWAMLIFSVSFQFYQMSLKRQRRLTSEF